MHADRVALHTARQIREDTIRKGVSIIQADPAARGQVHRDIPDLLRIDPHIRVQLHALTSISPHVTVGIEHYICHLGIRQGLRQWPQTGQVVLHPARGLHDVGAVIIGHLAEHIHDRVHAGRGDAALGQLPLHAMGGISSVQCQRIFRQFPHRIPRGSFLAPLH